MDGRGLGWIVAVSACAAEPGSATDFGDGGSTSVAGATTSGTAASATGTSSPGVDTTAGGVDGTSSSDGFVFDVATVPDTRDQPPVSMCKVGEDELSGVGPCEDVAPAESFEPDVQWEFVGPPGYTACLTPPLVANLSDDDDNGEIDLCDVPDVVVVAGPGSETGPGHIFILNGETGAVQLEFPHNVQLGATPALGDIDGDGIPEIVTVEPTATCNLVAFDHDGTLKWTSDVSWMGCQTSSVALADLDADGDVEIIAGSNVYDHLGVLQFSDPTIGIYSASTAADLDGDGQLEAIFGHAAYRADGTVYYARPEVHGGNFQIAAHPQVANLDDDPEPEVLLAANDGIWLLDHQGNVVWQSFAPTGETNDWNRPANIHDFDGDGEPEFGISALQHYGVYETDQSLLWVADIVDFSGQAGGTAFDFLGAGQAQAIYADESNMWVFDDDGTVLLSTPRSSATWIEYPTVADIDNDGSAEILVGADGGTGFAVQAIRDMGDAWVPARRIWNQHTYHVTNVREDGTIPTVEEPSWENLNTFRTQAQIASGGNVCDPEPRG
ncbi:MAG: VCBS repeat-containing protein [Myxococcota bacterium]